MSPDPRFSKLSSGSRLSASTPICVGSSAFQESRNRGTSMGFALPSMPRKSTVTGRFMVTWPATCVDSTTVLMSPSASVNSFRKILSSLFGSLSAIAIRMPSCGSAPRKAEIASVVAPPSTISTSTNPNMAVASMSAATASRRPSRTASSRRNIRSASVSPCSGVPSRTN